MKKAQVQAITVVLISGIVISLVGVSYMWGKPLIDKRSTISQFTSTVKFMDELNNKIVDMAGTCSFEGACEESMDLPVPGIVWLDESTNTITYEFNVEQPLITQGEVLFNTVDNGTVAEYGETPGVLSLKGERLPEGGYKLEFRLRYRELDSGDPPRPRGYKIEMDRIGKEAGNSRITVSYAGSETRADSAQNGGDLMISKIKVQTI